MGVGASKDKEGRTRYRVTFSRNGRRLVDERLPAGTSKEKAEAYYARIVGEWFDRDRLGVSEVPLISAVIREYESRLMPRMRSKFSRTCIRVLAPHVIGKTLAELDEAAESYMNANRDLAPASIHKRLVFLSQLGKLARKWKMVDRPYSLTVELPGFNNARQFYIGKAQLAAILKHADKATRLACWQLFYAGLRRGELYNAVITKEAYVLSMTKNGAPRIVPVPLPLKRIVGRPTMHPDVLTDRFKKAAVKAGYGHLRLHDLRHSTASMLLNAGADLGVVGFILGHRNGKSTRRYAHLATETARGWLNFAATGRKVIDFAKGQEGGPPASGKKKAA